MTSEHKYWWDQRSPLKGGGPQNIDRGENRRKNFLIKGHLLPYPDQKKKKKQNKSLNLGTFPSPTDKDALRTR